MEWTFGWLTRNRRLSNGYEGMVQISETLIEVAMIRLITQADSESSMNFTKQALTSGEPPKARVLRTVYASGFQKAPP